MPELIVHIVPHLAPMTQGRRCWFGHTWLVVDDGEREWAYGFNPVVRSRLDPRRLFTQGAVHRDDPSKYTQPHYQRRFEIDHAAAQRLRSWAEAGGDGAYERYHILSRNCIRFVWEALRVVGLGLVDQPTFKGALWPWSNRSAIDRVVAMPPHARPSPRP